MSPCAAINNPSDRSSGNTVMSCQFVLTWRCAAPFVNFSYVSDRGGLQFHAPAIVTLLKKCRPTTVARFVISIVVNSVKCAVRRPESHVKKEGEKRVLPAGANGNATTTIILPITIARIRTSLAHFAPCFIFGRITATHSKTMFQSTAINIHERSVSLTMSLA